jgi:hypothetical protein
MTTTAYVCGLSRTVVDASAGQHRSGPLVTTAPKLLHTQVAEWAGHSVAVLHQIYVKVRDGQEASARGHPVTAERILAAPLVPHRDPP